MVTGIMGSERPYDPKRDCGEGCRNRRTDEALEVTTKVLAGVAAVGISAGLVLLLASPRAEKPGVAPSLGLNVSTSKATAKAVWRF